ncbi:MAG: OmpA family protein [Arachidicoccus sp.]|nr:OmpA family protein [Arachidicoccus sp.]
MNLKLNKKKVLTAAAGLFTISSAMAQNDSIPRVTPFSGTSDYRTWSIGVWGGGSAAVAPFGGPNDFGSYDFHNVGLVYGAYIKKQIFHAFGLQLDFMRGKVKGSQKNDQEPFSLVNVGGSESIDGITKFKTDINWSASLSGVFTLGTINWLNKQATVTPYVSAGGGVIAYRNQVAASDDNYSYTYNGNQVNAKPDSKRSFFIPVGVGAKFNVSRGINIDLAYKLNFVNSPYFDGVAGYKGRDDKFSSLNLGLEFALGDKHKPQLAVVNPAAQLAMDLWDRNQYLKEQLKESDERNAAAVQELQQKLDDANKDTDGDGVPDIHDKCPNTESGVRVDGAGCPLPQPKQIIEKEKVVVTQEDRKVVDEAIKDLQFDLSKATIRPESDASLDRVAELLINKNFSLKLAGHTDNTGNFNSNMRLSKERAEAVKEYLVSKGANPSRIEAVGYGSTQPIATNKTAEGRQKNRRVEFTLY